MINSFNLEVLKKLVFSFFLFIFALLISYLIWQLAFAEEITREATTEIASQTIEELSKNIDVEVWNRVKDLPLEKPALTKLLQDIIGIQMAEQLLPDCEQYVLRVKVAGMYPVLQTTSKGRSEIKELIWLNVGEVWRYGMTRGNEKNRYPDGIFFLSKDGMYKLTRFHFEYYPEVKGTLMQVLIEEKIKIYSYPLMPECISRVSLGEGFLAIPPGNKVHK